MEFLCRAAIALSLMAATTTCLVGCSFLFNPSSDLSSGGTSSSDANDGGTNVDASSSSDVVSEVSSSLDASDDTGNGAANLVPNASFENGVEPCGSGWGMTEGTLQTNTLPRTGVRSCQICPGGPYSRLRRESSQVTSAIVGDAYSVEAWVRAPPGVVGASVAVGVDFEEGSSENSSFSSVSDANWTKVSFNVVVKQAQLGWHMRFWVWLDQTCILVDDVAMTKQ